MGGGQAAARGKDARSSAALPGKHSREARFVGAATVTELMPARRRISSNRPVSAHAVAAPATAAGAIMVDVSKKAAYQDPHLEVIGITTAWGDTRTRALLD